MNKSLPATRIRNLVKVLRNLSGKASLTAFLFAWPFVTLYVAAAWFMVDEARGNSGDAAGRLYFLGAFMLYVYPLILWLKVKVSYAAIGAAALSMRVLPVLVAVVTWLAVNGALPTGIVTWDGKSDWADAILYSAFTTLAALLFWMRASKNQASLFNVPRQHYDHPTQENQNGTNHPNIRKH